MTHEEVVAFFAEQEREWNRRDSAALTLRHADQGTIVSPIFRTVHGRAEILVVPVAVRDLSGLALRRTAAGDRWRPGGAGVRRRCDAQRRVHGAPSERAQVFHHRGETVRDGGQSHRPRAPVLRLHRAVNPDWYPARQAGKGVTRIVLAIQRAWVKAAACRTASVMSNARAIVSVTPIPTS